MVTDNSSGHFPEVFETYLSMLTEKKTTLSVKVGGSLIQIEVGHLYHCYENQLEIPYLESFYIVCCPIYILNCHPVSWITVQDFGTSAILCHTTRTSFEKIKVRNSFMHEINIDIGMFDLLKSFLIIIKKGEAWIDLWLTISPSKALICLNPVLISKTTLLL